MAAAHLSVDDLRLERQIQFAKPGCGAASTPGPAFEPPGGAEMMAVLAKDLRARIDLGAGLDLNEAILTVLETLHRAAGFDRVLFCLLDAGRTSLLAKLGVGYNIESFIETFRFPLSAEGGPIALALTRRRDLFVDTERDGRFDRTTFMEVCHPRYFAILPLVMDNVAAGCLYCDRISEHPRLEDGPKRLAAELRNLAVRVIALTRRVTPG